MILLLKKGKFLPVKISNNWYKICKWSDENIKKDCAEYYFLTIKEIFRNLLKLN